MRRRRLSFKAFPLPTPRITWQQGGGLYGPPCVTITAEVGVTEHASGRPAFRILRQVARGSRVGPQRVVLEWTRDEAYRMAQWLLTLRALERRAK